MIRANEQGDDLGDINSSLPVDDGAEEVRRLRNQEKQRRFFEHYHTGAVTTWRAADMSPHFATNYSIQGEAAVNLNFNFEEMEYRIMAQVSAAKRIDRTLRYGSKARKVDAKRALALNLSATSTLKLMKFMRQGRSSQFHAAWRA